MRILVVEDDLELARQLEAQLMDAGHDAVMADNGLVGFEVAIGENIDVMVVDRMMPELDGLSMIERLRSAGIETPALILSAMGEVDDRVTGLRSGADDYLAKPYAFSELLARIEVLGKRASVGDISTVLETSNLKLDRIQHEATRGNTKIALQPREYRLLEYLMMNAGQIVTRTMLLQNVWDLNFDPQTNVIDVHISRLRAKIDKGFSPQLLHTIRGSGYRFGE